MKKIINYKMYNTDTATEVASYCNGYSCGDFRHLQETLYRKKTGEFFLYGCGGAMTMYSTPSGDDWTGGEDISSLTEGDAKIWVMEHCDADTYIALFGEVEE